MELCAERHLIEMYFRGGRRIQECASQLLSGVPVLSWRSETLSRLQNDCVSGSSTMMVQVFDFHHQKFCPGSFTAKQAVHAAVATWPQGIRPVVHWSESQEGRKPHAHSDYVAVSLLPLCRSSLFPCLAPAWFVSAAFWAHHSLQLLCGDCLQCGG